MPLTQQYITETNGQLAVWHITENEMFFKDKLSLTDADRVELSERKGRRRLEWLAGKYLVQLMIDFKYKIIKDEFGKPHLEGSDGHISISHSAHWAVAIISPRAVGIDIQEVTPRLDRIAWRVMNENKLNQLDELHRLDHLHSYWCAKEAMYKAYGWRGLDFRKNMVIKPFVFPKNGLSEGVFRPVTEGVVLTDNFEKKFTLYLGKVDNCILVYCLLIT
ncbi:MAG: 4'-phosphopantetheinyl transferase superfamily protein [Saprospiraceae bacterium]|nr:4'-phosphopantetheinyl transferase superfamily protein [Saprospiraceae bacterium]